MTAVACHIRRVHSQSQPVLILVQTLERLKDEVEDKSLHYPTDYPEYYRQEFHAYAEVRSRPDRFTSVHLALPAQEVLACYEIPIASIELSQLYRKVTAGEYGVDGGVRGGTGYAVHVPQLLEAGEDAYLAGG